MKTLGIIRMAAASLLAIAASLQADARTWDFSSVPEADQANLNADKANWTYDSSKNRWGNVNTFDNQPLMANGVELTLTSGLHYTVTKADGLRVDPKTGSVTMNNKATVLTIPGLKKGDKVTITAKSSSSSTARSLTPTNLTVEAGFTSSTDRLDNIGTVIADGDVVITPSGGFYVYSITVDGDGGGSTPGGDDPQPQSDHSVKMNFNVNQMQLTTTGNEVKYYNTADIASVEFDAAAGSVTVVPGQGDWQDAWTRNITALGFRKAQATGGEGDIVDAGLRITEAKGWLETVYAKWELPVSDDIKSYNAYIKGGSYADWTPVDRELLRNYGTYGRVDVPGLPAGTYSLRIVATDAQGNEIANAEGFANNMDVRAYDRSGFAFKDAVPGAYNLDGSLKSGARVLYITKDNAKTVTLDIQTGVKNGAPQYTTGTGLQNILHLYEKAYEKRPLAFRFIGQIKKEDCDELQSKEEGLTIKGKGYTEVNVTFEGIGDDAVFHGFGILMDKVSNVEMRNIGVLWFMDDAVSIHASSHLWVHHLDLFYGQPGSASDQIKGDGTLDIKDDSQYTTFSYNHLWDSGKASLCGMKSETGPNYIDYHHNWFDHSDSRHPRIRTMTVHVWNNYYDGIAKYGVGAAYQSNAFVENNYFRGTKYAMLISKQGSDIAGDGKGTFSGEDGGIIKSFGNLYVDNTKKPIDYHSANVEFDCYEASSRDEQVPSSVKAKQGGRTYDNFDTNPSLMHVYTPDAAADVPAIVTGYYGAGRLNKGDMSWDFGPSEDKNYDLIVPLQTAVKTYTTKLVGIF